MSETHTNLAEIYRPVVVAQLPTELTVPSAKPVPEATPQKKQPKKFKKQLLDEQKAAVKLVASEPSNNTPRDIPEVIVPHPNIFNGLSLLDDNWVITLSVSRAEHEYLSETSGIRFSPRNSASGVRYFINDLLDHVAYGSTGDMIDAAYTRLRSAGEIEGIDAKLTAFYNSLPPDIDPDERRLREVVTLLDRQCLELARTNLKIWNYEDFIRNRLAPAADRLNAKDNIDELNQYRNLLIAEFDQLLVEELTINARKTNVAIRVITDDPEDLPTELHFNHCSATETPGSVIDRISITMLKVFYLNRARSTYENENNAVTAQKLTRTIITANRLVSVLVQGLETELLMIRAGKRAIYAPSAIKLYNDNTTNPLYTAKVREPSPDAIRVEAPTITKIIRD